LAIVNLDGVVLLLELWAEGERAMFSIADSTRRTTCALMLATLAVFAACEGRAPKQEPRFTDETCGTVVGAVPSRSSDPAERSLVAYPHEKALWLYDVSSDSVERVKDRVFSDERPDPQFTDVDSLTFVDWREEDEFLPFGRDSLYTLDIRSRAVTELLRTNATMLSYRWNADRTLLAYETWTTTFRIEEGERVPFSQTTLCLYDVASRAPRVLRQLEYVVGRGGHQGDERRITWSPSGERILVVDTVQPTHIYVVGLDGRDLVPPRMGTFARWINDQTIIYREENRLREDGRLRRGRWFTIDIATGKRSPFAMPSGASRPEFSPDGRLIAFDDGDKDNPSTYVFDSTTSRSRLLVRGYGAPIWISDDTVAVTAGGPCPPRTECNDFWTPLGRTVSVDVRTGARERLRLPTTGPFSEDVDVLLTNS
jgi:hypothetical protein